jgi:hypothetical protein
MDEGGCACEPGLFPAGEAAAVRLCARSKKSKKLTDGWRWGSPMREGKRERERERELESGAAVPYHHMCCIIGVSCVRMYVCGGCV